MGIGRNTGEIAMKVGENLASAGSIASTVTGGGGKTSTTHLQPLVTAVHGAASAGPDVPSAIFGAFRVPPAVLG